MNKEKVERPYSDNAIVDRDDIAKTHKGGPKMVDDWRQHSSSSNQPSAISAVQSISLQPVPPKDPQHSGTSGFRRAGSNRSTTPSESNSKLGMESKNASPPRDSGLSPTRSIGAATVEPARRSTSPTGSILTVESSVLNVPGPCSYHPENAPQFKFNKGSIIFAGHHSPVEKRKSDHPEIESPGPGTYFHPTSLVKPSFNKHAKLIDNHSGDELPAPPVHRIVIDLQMCSIGKRSSAAEKKEVRHQSKMQLRNIVRIKREGIDPFSWPPKPANSISRVQSYFLPAEQLDFNDVEIEGMTMQRYIDNIVSNIADKFDSADLNEKKALKESNGFDCEENVIKRRDSDGLTPVASYIQEIIQDTAMKYIQEMGESQSQMSSGIPAY